DQGKLFGCLWRRRDGQECHHGCSLALSGLHQPVHDAPPPLRQSRVISSFLDREIKEFGWTKNRTAAYKGCGPFLCRAAMSDFTLRPFAWSDIPAITAIYRHYVEHTAITFDTEAPGEEAIAEKYAGLLKLGHPVIIAEREGKVL